MPAFSPSMSYHYTGDLPYRNWWNIKLQDQILPGKAPGIITSSKSEEELLIKYIPIWAEITNGDEVITSGMDNIFFEGLKVGTITEVTNLADMKIATVKPYVNVLKKKYFYTYKNISSLDLKILNQKEQTK